jgi:hypothetical protein
MSDDGRLNAGLSGSFGPADPAALAAIRNTILDAEPLVTASGYDDPFDPNVLRIRLSDGIGGADWTRFDIRFSETDHYNIHHTNAAEVDFRWDRHPNTHSPLAHFHEPPNAGTEPAPASCIEVVEPTLVARAVVKLWRRAYESGELRGLNAGQNPP